jgi:uncharacterized membrane protein
MKDQKALTHQDRPSHLRHKRQRFWQILLPVLLGSLIPLAVAVLMVMTITGGATGLNVSQGADAALIWIIIPLMLVALLFTVILLGTIYGIAKLLNLLPGYTHLAQHYVSWAADKIQFGAKQASAPIIKLKGVSASVSAFFTALTGRSGN